LVENKQADRARDKLRDASREDPESIQASFLSGLLCVFAKRDFQYAKLEFSECVRREPDHQSSLNNLALVEVHLRRYSEALTHWKAALSAATPREEISQNLGRLMRLSEMGTCPLPSSTRQKFNELQQGLSAQTQGAYDSHVGWLYMPFDLNKEGLNPWIVPDKEMRGEESGKFKLKIGEDAFCMHCGGLGTVKCPNKECVGGSVPAGNKATATGVDRMTGRTIYLLTPLFAKCPVCQGRGRVPCPDCVNGIEKDLVGRVETIRSPGRKTVLKSSTKSLTP
jgi:hypothetical protein